jgi:hypothetical protein
VRRSGISTTCSFRRNRVEEGMRVAREVEVVTVTVGDGVLNVEVVFFCMSNSSSPPVFSHNE